MPGFFAHYLLGENELQRMSSGRLKQSIEMHHEAYTLGQQGPDIFFYYFLTIRGWKYKYGSVLHKKNTNRYFQYLLEARDKEAKYDRPIADAYLAGALGHYILDTHCHPYVYSRVGRKKSREIYGQHVALESDMDAALLMKYEKRKPSQTKMHRMIRVSAKERKVIARMVAYAMNHAYLDFPISNYNVSHAIRSMQLGARVLEDSTGWKTRLSAKIEKKLWGCLFATPMFCSDVVYGEDACNINHKLWKNPWEESILSNSSVFDMMDWAIQDYGHMIELLEGALERRCTYQTFLSKFGNLSYHSGLECER